MYAYVYNSVCVYMCVYICMYIYIYIYIYTYTHTHIYSYSQPGVHAGRDLVAGLHGRDAYSYYNPIYYYLVLLSDISIID